MPYSQEHLDYARRMIATAGLVVRDTWRARWIAAIACHESGWGRAIPPGSNNPFGYHWIGGHGWPYISATEAGTGETRRYRKFANSRAACWSVNYLIDRSTLPGYAIAREAHEETLARGELDEADALILWMIDFSRGYCPADIRHGPNVVKIYRELEAQL